MTDFRALCAELLDELENAIRVIYGEDGTRHISSADPVIAKVDAALAEPEPEGPTLAELDDLCAEHCFNCEDRESLECLLSVITDALARWGRPKPPSLKEQALALMEPQGSPARLLNEDQMGILRRAIEQLPDTH